METHEYNKPNDKATEMKTLATCINKAVKDGYVANFELKRSGLCVSGKPQCYLPGEIIVKDFYRFEGESDPSDESILYIIETKDGTKGTFTDAYGLYSDPGVSEFFKHVKSINKKTEKGDQKGK